MTRSPRPLVSHPSPRPSAVAVMLSSVTWPGCQMTSRHTRHSTAKSTYLWADHQAANGIAVPVVLTTDGLTRSRMTTTYHLPTSGGALSVVVITERRYGSCWLSDDNNNNNRSTGKLQFQPILSSIYWLAFFTWNAPVLWYSIKGFAVQHSALL